MHRLRRAGNLNKSLRKRRGKFVHRLEGEIEWKGEKSMLEGWGEVCS